MTADVTRSNYAANSTLTSTALNADLNQILTRINDFPGDKITDDTITKDKLSQGATANLAKNSETVSYTVVEGNQFNLIDTSGGAVTATLLTAIGNEGLVLFFKKTTGDANAITIDGNGSETIDGSTTKILYSQYDYLKIVSDGANWHIMENGIKNLIQRRLLDSDFTTNDSDVTGLTFASLVIGRRYRVSGQMRFTRTATALDNFGIQIRGAASGAGTKHGLIEIHVDSNGGAFTLPVNLTFVADSTGVYFYTESFSASSGIRGDGTTSETFIDIEDITERYATTTELD